MPRSSHRLADVEDKMVMNLTTQGCDYVGHWHHHSLPFFMARSPMYSDQAAVTKHSGTVRACMRACVRACVRADSHIAIRAKMSPTLRPDPPAPSLSLPAPHAAPVPRRDGRVPCVYVRIVCGRNVGRRAGRRQHLQIEGTDANRTLGVLRAAAPFFSTAIFNGKGDGNGATVKRHMAATTAYRLPRGCRLAAAWLPLRCVLGVLGLGYPRRSQAAAWLPLGCRLAAAQGCLERPGAGLPPAKPGCRVAAAQPAATLLSACCHAAASLPASPRGRRRRAGCPRRAGWAPPPSLLPRCCQPAATLLPACQPAPAAAAAASRVHCGRAGPRHPPAAAGWAVGPSNGHRRPWPRVATATETANVPVTKGRYAPPRRPSLDERAERARRVLYPPPTNPAASRGASRARPEARPVARPAA
eukprot:gene22884-biopygen20780